MVRSWLLFCSLPSVSDGGQLIPPRPHVVGDALADLGTVVKVSLTHWPGLPARQLVAAENGGKKNRGRTQVRFSCSSSFLLCGFSVWKNSKGSELSFKNDSDVQSLQYHLLWPDVETDIKQIYRTEKKWTGMHTWMRMYWNAFAFMDELGLVMPQRESG